MLLVLYWKSVLCSRASKVFTNHQMTVENGCLQCFSQVLTPECCSVLISVHLERSLYLSEYNIMQPLPVFLRGLEVRGKCPHLQAGIRQYLHRMVICLGDELLQYVPVAVSLLLTDCKVRTSITPQTFVNKISCSHKRFKNSFL